MKVEGRFQFRADQDANDFRIENLGAPINPNDAARLVDIGPGFYGITAKHHDNGTFFSGLNVFSFDEEFFYLTQNLTNLDEVHVNLRNLPGETNTASNLPGDEGIFFQKADVDLEFKSLTAGTNITLSSTDDAITINSTGGGDGGGGFYGLTVKHSDDSESFKGINTIAFNTDFFYITQNPTNTDEVLVNARDPNPKPIRSRTINIEQPTGSEDIGLFFTSVSITATRAIGVLRGSSNPSFYIQIRHDSDRSASGTPLFSGIQQLDSTTTGNFFIPNNDQTIPANSWVWLETGMKRGTVIESTITLEFTED